ncbi:MAG: rhomboid family intramembrane serine protease [Candidatus Bathyarchaeota archaeon]|nr:rhomboid family intramembrane serine protease [Candidatus Bathyarchaeota archaeon]
MYSSQKFKPTYILIALNIAVYVYTSIAGGNFLSTDSSMLVQYGQVNDLVINYGSYYQLFTSMFIHADIAHIVGNMLFLFIFGLRGEEMFSLPEYLSIYLLGGLTGNFLSLLLLPGATISVGASGAIFAMFGATVIYARRSFRQSIIGALIYAFFLLFLSSGVGVNNFAHIGGLVAGLVIGYVVATRRKPETRYTIGYSYSAFP